MDYDYNTCRKHILKEIFDTNYKLIHLKKEIANTIETSEKFRLIQEYEKLKHHGVKLRNALLLKK
jgi:hypothetical protein